MPDIQSELSAISVRPRNGKDHRSNSSIPDGHKIKVKIIDAALADRLRVCARRQYIQTVHVSFSPLHRSIRVRKWRQ